MEILSAVCTDIGIKKDTNQDSLLIKIADTEIGKVALAVICDGMGGLAKGEVASRNIIDAFEDWFDNDFPKQLEKYNSDDIQYSWERIIQMQNRKIAEYGQKINVQLGTTLTAMLVISNKQIIIGHVGDSRVYKINDNSVTVLTEDQTVVANEIKQGRMTPEQAAVDPRRNVLLQCIGASRVVKPDYIVLIPEMNTSYMLCSDGFRHVIGDDMIHNAFKPEALTDEITMENRIRDLIEENKKRGEIDNITALLLKLY